MLRGVQMRQRARLAMSEAPIHTSSSAFTPHLRVRGEADDDNSMLLVLVSLPTLPTPTTCAQAVATLNADEALAKELAAYNKTDCMSYDFDPKNQRSRRR